MTAVGAATRDALEASLDEAREDFAANLMRWRRLNGWAQDTAEQWARAAGFAPIANSQWSKMERGQQPKPGPLLFRCFGVINHKLHVQDWGPVRSRTLLERVQQGRPILHDDGTPWDGNDFYAAFMGLLEWPPFPGLRRQVTEVETEAWNRQFCQWFEQITAAADLTLLSGLQSLMDHVPDEHQEVMQLAVLGRGGFTSSDLQELSSNEGLAPENWLQEWQRALGLGLPMELGSWWRKLHAGAQAATSGNKA